MDERDDEQPSDDTPAEEASQEPPPRPSIPIEAYAEYHRRVKEDAADGGRVADLMLEYAAAQPDDVREKLDTDVSEFNRVFDIFKGGLPSRRQEAPPPPPPPQRVEFSPPKWRQEQIAKEARRSRPVLDATFAISPGFVPPPGDEKRKAQQKTTAEINSIRRRIQEGSRDAEVDLAQKLFPHGIGNPSWGPARDD